MKTGSRSSRIWHKVRVVRDRFEAALDRMIIRKSDRAVRFGGHYEVGYWRLDGARLRVINKIEKETS